MPLCPGYFSMYFLLHNYNTVIKISKFNIETCHYLVHSPYSKISSVFPVKSFITVFPIPGFIFVFNNDSKN